MSKLQKFLFRSVDMIIILTLVLGGVTAVLAQDIQPTPEPTVEPTQLPVQEPTPLPTEPPVVTDEPVVTEPPVVTEIPVVTELPVVTEPPVIPEEELPIPTIMSDYPDYNPGQLVTLTGTNWQGDTQVRIVVVDNFTDTWSHDYIVDVAEDGSISYSFNLPTWYVANYLVSAGGNITGRVVTTSFTDANPSASLDQCANDPSPSPSTDGCNSAASEWVNGNLGASKSVYYEGDSIPYRLTFGNLSLASHTVTIEWDTTKGGHHALDYLTSFNRTVATADPCLGVSGCPSSVSTFPIPADTQVTGAGVTPDPGVFTLYGGEITAVSAYSYANGTGFAGDKSARITITFTASVVNPVLAWGGHIATRRDWGMESSAVSIPGSPYHTRLIDLDGSGGNQDRSLSADAVIFPGSITIIKDAVPNGDDVFNFTATPSPLADFTLVDDGTSANTKVFPGITNFTTYNIAEVVPSGWTLTGIVCSVTSPNGGSYSVTLPSVSITLKEGENYTCTFGDEEQAAHLIVIKHVINAYGGTKTASDFAITVTGNSPSPASFPGAESPGTDVTLSHGAYSVSELELSGYSASYSADCSGSIAAGQTKYCTITNSDIQPTLTLVKTVVNDNGGTLGVSDFPLFIGSTPATSGVTYGLNAGSYTASETEQYGYTASDWGGDCAVNGSVTLAVGDEKTCTITNSDVQPKLKLVKTVVNSYGGTATAADFQGSVSGTDVDWDVFVGFDAGDYTADETGLYGYTASDWGGDCAVNGSVTLAVGDEKTCEITNYDLPGTIIIIKNAKPASGSFAFSTTGTGFDLFDLNGDPTGEGNINTQLLAAGTYTVTESTQLGWILTGIGGSLDPATPYNCTVTGQGGSSGHGDLGTQTATIYLKNGDSVTCVFENTGEGVTRTQGFWATHPQLAEIAWFGGSAFGHTFPGVAGTFGIGDNLICGRPVDTLGKLMAGFWSNIPKTSLGDKRSSLEQSRMQLLQQLLAAELNASAFGSVPASGSFDEWEDALCGNSMKDIKTAVQQAASFNTAGDSGTFTPGTSADSKYARSIADANADFWDIIKP